MNALPSPFVKNITLKGFLSFGPKAREIPLRALNVLIGANASGKSNLVEAFSVLRSLPRDVSLPIRQGGGVRDWLWQKQSSAGATPAESHGSDAPDEEETGARSACLEIVLGEGCGGRTTHFSRALRYRFVFGAQGDSFVVLDERLEDAAVLPGESAPCCYYGYEGGTPTLKLEQGRRELRREDLDGTQSILSQRKDPDMYPALTLLADLLAQVRIYRNWSFGPDSSVRRACRPDVRTDYLSEDFDNLPARLAALRRSAVVKQRLIKYLYELAPGFQDFEIVPEGGSLNLYLTEGNLSLPARRLSDGTLRYLCLLAILLDPQPPPLTIIEEPELGLHPDVLLSLRELMIDAGSRTQLLVTTHSIQLVDTLTDDADSVLVCEKEAGASVIQRLTQEYVAHWREHGSLGDLWISGHIGGTRW